MKLKDYLYLNCDTKNTADNYYNQINKFLSRVKEPVDQEKINEYLIWRKEKFGTQTYNLSIASIKKYLEYTKLDLELPKTKARDKRVNTYFKVEEFEKDIIPYLSMVFSKKYFKYELVLRILFTAGLRKEELVNLKRENINLTNNSIDVLKTKKHKDRKTIFSKKLVRPIKEYFDQEPEEINAFNITKDEIDYIFKELNSMIGFRVRLHCRIFRHSCAINWLRNGIDLFTVKKMLGHSKIETTEIYAEPDFDDMLEIYNKRMK